MAAASKILSGLAEEDLGELPLEALVEELSLYADEIVRSAAIVLDDYHLVDSAAVHRAVQSLVEAGPRHLHVVLATREDPPLRLAQLRARPAGRDPVGRSQVRPG